MQRPPCSFFAAEGSGELTAAAAADGDCTMEPMRQQQQEMFELDDDLLEQQAAEAVQQGQQQREKPAEGAGKGSGAHADSQWRRPPVDQDGGKQAAQQDGQDDDTDDAAQEAVPSHAAGQAVQQQNQQHKQQQKQQQDQQQQAKDAAQQAEQPAAPGIQHAGQANAAGQHMQHQGAPASGATARGSSSGSASSGSGGKDSMSSVAVGLVVAAAAVMSLAFAVALLQVRQSRGSSGTKRSSAGQQALLCWWASGPLHCDVTRCHAVHSCAATVLLLAAFSQALIVDSGSPLACSQQCGSVFTTCLVAPGAPHACVMRQCAVAVSGLRMLPPLAAGQ